MKKEKSRRGLVIVILALVVLIFLVGISAVGVYAARSVNNQLGSLLSQVNPLTTEPALQDESNIYEQGVLVRHVTAGSPAAEAGLRRGSIIQEVDGTAVNTPADLTTALNAKGPGARVQLQILNSLIPKSVTVTLADAAPLLGVRLVDDAANGFGNSDCNCEHEGFMPPGGFGQFRLDPDNMPFDMDMFTAGVLVAAVSPDSAAAAANLQEGDVITAIGDTAVATPDELVAILSKMQPGDSIDLTIQRDDAEQTITATLRTHPEDNTKAFLGISTAAAFAEEFSRGLGSQHGQMPFDPNDFDFGEGFSHGGHMGTSEFGIVAVVPGSAAEAAGLQAGDAVTHVNGTAVDSVDAFIAEFSSLQPGDSVELSIEREGEPLDLSATLGTHPEDDNKAFLGVELGAFYNVDVDQFGLGSEFMPDRFFEMNPDGDFNMPFDLENLEELQEMFPELFDELPMEPIESEELDA